MPRRKKNDPVTAYAADVLEGKIVASRWVKMACQRHFDDLDRAKHDKNIIWDLAAMTRALEFFPDVLRLNGGQFEGKPFHLIPFEKFIVGSLFGWKLQDGTRRYQKAYIEIGKGNGKSPLAAGIGMKGLVDDDEPRAEIYAAATKHDQAMILFRDAVAMRDQSPHLTQRLTKSGIGEKSWNLAYLKTGSWFRPISSDQDSQSGPRPHMALVDEVHEHKNGTVITMLEEGFKWRRNPLLFMITNSGTSRESPCWYYHEYGARILKKTAENDRFFVFICSLDPCEEHRNEGQEQPLDNCLQCDDWRIEGDHWLKANPALDVIITRQRLRDNVRTALDMPSEENTVRRLNFCYWTQQETRWLSMQAWDACAGPIDYEKLKGRECIMGVDLANKIDIAALVLLFPPEKLPLVPATSSENGDASATVDIDELDDEFIVLPYFFVPCETIEEAKRRDNVPYDVWVKQGLIEATEGPTIDYQAIKQKIIALNEIYPVKTIWEKSTSLHLAGYDPWNATQFASDMRDTHGINMVEVRQGYATLSEPTKEMARLLKAKKVRHGGNAVLRWMADNVIVRTDPAGNIKPDKETSKQKIDGIVALVMALALAIRNAYAERSVYEERGVLVAG
jgi:phage terminase large subunit-like protein